ncbi:hypothetical protein BJX99DRAFT_217298 [Aspergillus californicus]
MIIYLEVASRSQIVAGHTHAKRWLNISAILLPDSMSNTAYLKIYVRANTGIIQ